MREPFQNKSGVIYRKCVDEQQYANAQYLITKQPNLVSKRNSIEKARSNIFDCIR